MKIIKTAVAKKVDSTVNKIAWPVYFYSVAIMQIIYFLLFLGVVSINSEYVNLLNISIQLFIIFFLMYRFNPFRNHKLEPYDSPIIFGSAIFLLTNLGFTQYIYYYTKKIITKNNTIDHALRKIFPKIDLPTNK